MATYHEVGLLNFDSKREKWMLLECSTVIHRLVFNPLALEMDI